MQLAGRFIALASVLSLLAATTPASPVSHTFTNKGFVGFGRISGNAKDSYGESIGGFRSAIALDSSIKHADGIRTFSLVADPDRGHNTQVTTDYRARQHKFTLNFDPSKGSSTTENITTTYVSSVLWKTDPSTFAGSNNFTTGLDATAVRPASAPQPALPSSTIASRAPKTRSKALQEGPSSSSAAGTGTGELVVGGNEATDAGMFGVLTRQYRHWYPTRLLYKRYGVSDPHPDYTGVKYGEDDGGGGGGGDGQGQEQEQMNPFGSSSGSRKRAGGGGGRGNSDVNALWEQNKRGIEQLARERQWGSSAADTGTGPGPGRDGEALMEDRSGQAGRGT
ncbi:hypothetical protein V8E36_007822 [Tilletia maclaganii]